MNKLYIICVEDQREVLNAVVADLQALESYLVLEECESAQEAWDVLEDIDAAGDLPALVISDHVMPGQTGVDFLISLHQDERFRATRKMLLTGLATHQDTIHAINRAAVDRYLEKPWQQERLLQYAKELLTGYILDKGLDYRAYLPVLDNAVLLEGLRRRGGE